MEKMKPFSVAVLAIGYSSRKDLSQNLREGVNIWSSKGSNQPMITDF